jgi:hypothetical protein
MPNQHGTGNMITLNSRLAALTRLNTSQLFKFTMKFLNIPPEVANSIYFRGVVLS